MSACRTAILLGVLIVTMGFPYATNAQKTNFYAGVGVGQSKAKDACQGVTISCDDTDFGWKIFGGYQFSEMWGIEAAYTDFGKASASGVIAGASVSADAEATAFEVVGTLTFPIADKFSAFGKVGFYRWDVDTSASAAVPGFASRSSSDDGTDWTFGLGLRYDFTNTIGARLEWQRYNNVGDTATTGKSSIDFFNLGVVVKF